METMTSRSLPTDKYPSYNYLATFVDGSKTNRMEQYCPVREKSFDQSLACFAPGNFLLGGRALNRTDIFQFGLSILEGCWHAYNATPAGIAPEDWFICNFYLIVEWAWRSSDISQDFFSPIDSAQWDSHALLPVNSEYQLRPGLAMALNF